MEIMRKKKNQEEKRKMLFKRLYRNTANNKVKHVLEEKYIDVPTTGAGKISFCVGKKGGYSFRILCITSKLSDRR
jgi:hypothetical protein